MRKMAGSNLPELPNTMFTGMICWMSNGKDIILAPKHLQASYTDVRYWEQLIDFINKNGGPKVPWSLDPIFKCTLKQHKFGEEYMELYTYGQMIDNPMYNQISYNCCLSNAFQLEDGHNVKIFLVEIM